MNEKKAISPANDGRIRIDYIEAALLDSGFRRSIMMNPPTVLEPQGSAAGTREDLLMKLTRRFAEMTPEKRPQDPHLGRDRPAL
jgi:hypothetical protein